MKYDSVFLMIAPFLIGLAIGAGFISSLWHVNNLRAIESGDAQYHPTTGEFLFNGELKAE